VICEFDLINGKEFKYMKRIRIRKRKRIRIRKRKRKRKRKIKIKKRIIKRKWRTC
jgi:hypothetical protein